MAIYKALLKYDHSGFKLEILEYCEPGNCIEREQYYLDLLNPEYNILKTAGSCLGLTFKHSPETKKRMSEAKKGNNHSEETKQKISDAMKGNKSRLGRHRPDGAGKLSVQVEVLDLYTDIKTTYGSISEAAKVLGVDQGGISKYISQNTQRPYKGRYKLSKS
jgi:group I intron endonuclease